MSRAARFGPAALAAVLLLAGCGGGGSSPVKPAVAPQSTAAPASNRTAVGTASLTIAFPKVLSVGKSQAAKRANASTKRPQFVDPQPTPGGAAPTNLLDIYVDGTLIQGTDGSQAFDASLEVSSAGLGTQTTTLPLFSTSTNMIVVVEFDGNHQNMLAIGETNLSTFNAGTTNNISLTMQMNAESLAIVEMPTENNPLDMSNVDSPYGITDFACTPGTGGSASIGVYEVDSNGNFTPQAVGGISGTGFATVTGTSDGLGGLTSISAPQSAFPGLYTITFDTSCNSIALQGTAPNPAHSIYADVVGNINYGNGYDNGTVNGPNQGIYDLLQYNPFSSFSLQYFQNAFAQAANVTALGAIDVSNLNNS